MTKPRKWSVVRVKWIDATSFYDASDSSENHPLATRYTVGHLIRWNAKQITLAMEDDRKTALGTDCQTVTSIPLGMVERVVAYPENDKPFTAYQRNEACESTE